MCNPNSTIAAYRRHARAQQLRQLEASGSAAAQKLLRPGYVREHTLPSQNGATVPTNETFCSSVYSPASDVKVEFREMGVVPKLLPLDAGSKEIVPKSKPKRRRKPQKPGKTAKQNDRHFVVHNYHDHANDQDDGEDPNIIFEGQGRNALSFPIKLHEILDQVEADGLSHIISWQPHGRCFVIHDPKQFADHVMPSYFRQTKLTSFQRQLNLYGFNRITRGRDSKGYYHELFLRGKVFLCKHMTRTKVKGTKFKAASNPANEPNFYMMPPVQYAHQVTPQQSDCDTSDDGQSFGAPNQAATTISSWQDVSRNACQESSSPQEALCQELATGFSSWSTGPAYAPAQLPSTPESYTMLQQQSSLDETELQELLCDQLPKELSHQSSTTPAGELDLTNIWDPINYDGENSNELACDSQLGASYLRATHSTCLDV
eukprot:scaffold24656_cov181-Cylindrotheca_fusiformis.AAC.3